MMHGLKQLIQSLTRVTCSTSTFIDYILTNAPSRLFQKGVINVDISDHQLILYTRKISRIRTGGAHKYLNFHSLKNYTIDYYQEALQQVDFPNYKSFGDVNEVYSNFFQKLMTVIDKITPYKSKQVKGNTQKWFDDEVLEKLNLRNKLFKKFKKLRLHIDKEKSHTCEEGGAHFRISFWHLLMNLKNKSLLKKLLKWANKKKIILIFTVLHFLKEP